MDGRRAHQRYATNAKANCTIRPYSMLGILKDEIKTEGIIKNMSCNGMKLNIYGKFRKNAQVFVEITLRGLNTTIEATGRIIWLKQDHDTIICGIRFDWVSDEYMYYKYIKMLEEAETIY